ncbi:MAG: hypothetical protein U0228_13085 [Myxococcaceae bacterium]
MWVALPLLVLLAGPPPGCALTGSGPLPEGLVYARGALHPFARTVPFKFAHDLTVQLPPTIAQRAPVLIASRRVRFEVELKSDATLRARVRRPFHASVLEPWLGGPVELKFSTAKGALVHLPEPEIYRPSAPLDVEVACDAVELGAPYPQGGGGALRQVVQLRGDEVEISESATGATVGVLTDEPYAELTGAQGDRAHVRVTTELGVIDGWVAKSVLSAVEGNHATGFGALEGKADQDVREASGDEVTCRQPVALAGRLDSASWPLGRLEAGTPFTVVKSGATGTVISLQPDGLELLPGVELVLDAAAWKACR